MKKYILLLGIVLMFMGELNEIGYQTVNYGENIIQNAVIHTISNNGMSYYSPCHDCNASISIKEKSVYIVLNREMSNLGFGKFGYLALSGELKTDVIYTMIVNTSSSSKGSGIVESQFMVNKNPVINNIQTNTDNNGLSLNSILPTFDTIGFLNVFFDWLNYTDSTKTTRSIYYNITHGISGFFITIFNTFFGILGLIKWMLGLIFGTLDENNNSNHNGLIDYLYLIFTEPQNFVYNVLTPFIFGVGGFLIGLYAIWTIFFEFVIIALVMSRYPNAEITELLYNVVLYHFYVVYYVFYLVYASIIAVYHIVTGILRMVSLFKPVGGG